jgi:hypothetical protein
MHVDPRFNNMQRASMMSWEVAISSPKRLLPFDRKSKKWPLDETTYFPSKRWRFFFPFLPSFSFVQIV